MTSEVENILNGQVVRKVNADKAIGVSAKNLSPDEKGEIPLSKQSAFIIESPNIPADKVQENMETFGEDMVESVDLDLNQDGIVTGSPVDVTPPTSLTEFNLNIPSLGKDTEESNAALEVPSEETHEVFEMPTMPNEILAQAPTEINNNLFATAADKPVEAAAAPASQSVVDTPFTVPTNDTVSQPDANVTTGESAITKEGEDPAPSFDAVNPVPAADPVVSTREEAAQVPSFDQIKPAQIDTTEVKEKLDTALEGFNKEDFDKAFEELKGEINRTLDEYANKFKGAAKTDAISQEEFVAEKSELPQPDLVNHVAPAEVATPNDVIVPVQGDLTNPVPAADEMVNALDAVDDTQIQGKFI